MEGEELRGSFSSDGPSRGREGWIKLLTGEENHRWKRA